MSSLRACDLRGFIFGTCWASIPTLSRKKPGGAAKRADASRTASPTASRSPDRRLIAGDRPGRGSRSRSSASRCWCGSCTCGRSARSPFFALLMGDARGYDEWAQRIAGGDWLGHEVFYQAPLYPYLLGVIYAIAGRHLLARPHRPGADRVGVVRAARARRARGCSRGRAGIAAGLMLALYAPAIFFDGLLQKSVLDVFFVCLALWLMSRSEGTAETAKTAENAQRNIFSAISAVSAVPSVRGSGLDDGRAGADARERARLHRRHPRVDHRERRLAAVERRNGCRAARCSWPASRSSCVPVAARNATSAAASTSRRRSSDRTSTSATIPPPTAPISRCASAAARRSTSGRTPPSSPSARSDTRSRRRKSRATGPTRRSTSSRRSPGAWLTLMGRKVALLWNADRDGRHREPGDARGMVAAAARSAASSDTSASSCRWRCSASSSPGRCDRGFGCSTR